MDLHKKPQCVTLKKLMNQRIFYKSRICGRYSTFTTDENPSLAMKKGATIKLTSKKHNYSREKNPGLSDLSQTLLDLIIGECGHCLAIATMPLSFKWISAIFSLPALTTKIFFPLLLEANYSTNFSKWSTSCAKSETN